MPAMSKALQRHFAQNATGYYVATRFAVRVGLALTAGTLAHHTIEQYLKSSLAGEMSLEQLKALGHNLPRLWKAFRAGQDPAFSRYDSSVREVDRFERLRYPDYLQHEGATVITGAQPDVGLRSHPMIGDMPIYTLAVDELDELVITILDCAGLSPRILRPLDEEALATLERTNKFAARWALVVG